MTHTNHIKISLDESNNRYLYCNFHNIKYMLIHMPFRQIYKKKLFLNSLSQHENMLNIHFYIRSIVKTWLQ